MFIPQPPEDLDPRVNAWRYWLAQYLASSMQDVERNAALLPGRDDNLSVPSNAVHTDDGQILHGSTRTSWLKTDLPTGKEPLGLALIGDMHIESLGHDEVGFSNDKWDPTIHSPSPVRILSRMQFHPPDRDDHLEGTPQLGNVSGYVMGHGSHDPGADLAAPTQGVTVSWVHPQAGGGILSDTNPTPTYAFAGAPVGIDASGKIFSADGTPSSLAVGLLASAPANSVYTLAPGGLNVTSVITSGVCNVNNEAFVAAEFAGLVAGQKLYVYNGQLSAAQTTRQFIGIYLGAYFPGINRMVLVNPVSTAALAASSALGGIVRTNNTGATINMGAPVALSGNTDIVLANASAVATFCFGVAAQDIANGASGLVIPQGPVTRTDWSAILGAVTLTADTYYYLAATAGNITPTQPTTVGQIAQLVGCAVDTQTLVVNVGQPMQL